MKIKKYQIKTSQDIQKMCYAALKKVYSPTLYPRVLLNFKNKKIEEIFAKKAYFDAIFISNSHFFAKKVHNTDYDLGMFLYQKKDKTFLKLYDGTGHIASSFVTNIFDRTFSMTDLEFDLEKKYIKKMYSKINKKKLLIQNKKAENKM